MKYQNLILEKKDGVATLTLNRPDKLNAVSLDMAGELPKAVDEVRNDDEVGVLVITGAGRAFSAGTDLSGVTGEEKSRRSILAPLGIWAISLAELEKPTIAAVNGVAVGMGLSFALLCDIRIAAESSRFGAVWVKRGLIADGGATYLLPMILGKSKALELMYAGDFVDSKEAERIGLVSRVVPDGDLMKVTLELATKIAKGASLAIELTKRAVYGEVLKDLRTSLDFESYAQNICLQSEDYKEGVNAFFEKREARFKGR